MMVAVCNQNVGKAVSQLATVTKSSRDRSEIPSHLGLFKMCFISFKLHDHTCITSTAGINTYVYVHTIKSTVRDMYTLIV